MLVEKKKSKFFNLNKDGLQKDNNKSKEEEKEASRRKSPDQGEETPEHFPTSQFFLTKPMTLENINEVMKEDRNAIKSKRSAVRKTRSSNVNPITIPSLHHFLSPKDKVPNYLSLKGIASENGEYISHRFQKDCECPSILIVDDQYINRFIIKQF